MNLLQVDNFASDALEVREKVIAGEFKTRAGPDGLDYTGISDFAVPHWNEQLAHVMGRPITTRLSCFRLNLKGERPHSLIHSDNICGAWASVLYLNTPPQCRGGTAFWRHTGLNLESLPPNDAIAASGFEPRWFLTMMRAEWGSLEFWEQSGFVGMAFNRLIVYPSSRFHSRYPFEPFGDGPSDGRLIWICHFDA